MAGRQIESVNERTLSSLGIDEAEERAYRWILEHSGACAQELSGALALGPKKAQGLLESIEAKGLVTHSPERPRRYFPSAPDIALGALFLQQQKALLETQHTIQELQEQVSVSQHSDEQKQMVELITSREAERQILEQMDRTVQHEFITLMRGPMRVSQLDVPAEKDHPAQREALKRGVSYRTVIDSKLLENPAFTDTIRSDMDAGEEIKVALNLPLKLVLVDHRIGLIPLNLGELDSPALLVRSSSLLDAFYELFEMLWERAAPISFNKASKLVASPADTKFGEEIKGLISLMAAGLNDKTIAYDLNISKRTLERRIAELMQVLNARTRFQVGWLAALRLSGAVSGGLPGFDKPAALESARADK